MPQDTFTIRLIAKELNTVLSGGRINKINQPEREELSFLIYTGKQTLKLCVNANAGECGVYFTQNDRENPAVAPNFCMLLRKHLSGAQILGVETPGFERIVILRFKCSSDFSSCSRELYCEIMGKYSNIILTENGTILGAIKTTTIDVNCKRTILPGAKYVLPSPQDKVNPENREALFSLLSSPPKGDLARFLFQNVAGLAPCTADQIVKAYSGGNFAEYLYSYLFSDEISPCVMEIDGVPTDFFARYVEGGIPFETISEAQSYFYAKKRTQKRNDGMRRKLLNAVSTSIKKHEKRLSQILDKKQECAFAEENKLKGELLTANLYALKRGMKSCELENYRKEGVMLKIKLDDSLSPSENAQAYFKRYRKQKRTLEILAPQEKETRSELDYYKSLLSLIESASSEDDFKSIEEELLLNGLLKAPKEQSRKKILESPFRTDEKDGFKILSGRNNLQNDRLVRSSSPDDIWLHAQHYHSCHVVIETLGREVPKNVLLYAASICARHSDAKGGSIPVDYCKIKNVKKPPKSKAGFVTYSEFKTLFVESSEKE